jgi:hypothetical protein
VSPLILVRSGRMRQRGRGKGRIFLPLVTDLWVAVLDLLTAGPTITGNRPPRSPYSLAPYSLAPAADSDLCKLDLMQGPTQGARWQR